ncbi:MAG: hypothetical protein KUG77_28755 [Nannocystaceae bacterium]|nr:hypothetical protein [Nannocystaceae bacterium]
MTQDTLRMGLADLLVDEGGTLFVLAAYPHPSDDWGGGHGTPEEPVECPDWRDPWDTEFWKDEVTCEPEEAGKEWKDVELAYDNLWVLVRSHGEWTKEALPYPCNLLRDVPGFGICAIGDEGVVVRTNGGSWTESEQLSPFVDIVSTGTSLLGANNEGYGRILENGPTWQKTHVEKFDNLCRTPSGIYLAGNGLSHLRNGSTREIMPASEKPGWVRVSKSPDEDGSAFAAATSGRGWVLDEEGAREEDVTLPEGFHVNLTVARFRGRNYAATGQSMTRGKDGVYNTVDLPLPSVVDEQYSWSQCGYLSVRVSGDILWVLGKHHITYSRDGEQWERLDFAK